MHFLPGELVRSDVGTREIGLNAAIGLDIHEAKDEARGEGRNGLSHASHLFKERFHRDGAREHQRVEAPHHARFAEALRERLKGGDAFLQTWYGGLEMLCFVVIEGELNVILLAIALQFVEALKEGLWVFAPKDDGSYLFKGDACQYATEGVSPMTVARFQPIEKPFHVEGRDIRGAANGKHRNGFLNGFR